MFFFFFFFLRVWFVERGSKLRMIASTDAFGSKGKLFDSGVFRSYLSGNKVCGTRGYKGFGRREVPFS